MNRRTITLALTIAILIVIGYKIFGPKTGPGHNDGGRDLQTKSSHFDPFVQIEFNNGDYGESNYQKHMENWLLVEKSIDPVDGRSRRIQLSKEGRSLWHEALLPKIFGYYEEALDGFSINDRVATLNDFNRLLENFKALDPNDSASEDHE